MSGAADGLKGARALLDAVLFDVGGTLVEEAAPGEPTSGLVARPLPGVADDLRALTAQGVRLGAVTNTSVMGEADVRRLLAPVGLADLLDIVVTSVDAGARKPDPRPLHVALERLGGAQRDRAVFVGDQPSDRAAAIAAGIPFVAHRSGARVGTALQHWLASVAGARFARAVAALRPPDPAAAAAADAQQSRLTKPAGALGALEELGARLAGIAGVSPPPVPDPATVVVFAADHGVLVEGVSPWPQEVTAQMVATFCGGGAAINVLARHAGARVLVVDVGVATPLLTQAPNLLVRRIRAGTADVAVEPAMTLTEARLALDVGVELAEQAVADGARCLIMGEMGIGNTTASAALIAALTGLPPALITGRGTGIDDLTLARKVAVVQRAVTRAMSPAMQQAGGSADPLGVLAALGGLEIAALAGFAVGGAAARVPVLIDGVNAAAASLVATALAPPALGFLVAGHRSSEPGSRAVLEHLGLRPLLDLELRLGEGTGATLALPLLQGAAKVLREMATFDAAGVTDTRTAGG